MIALFSDKYFCDPDRQSVCANPTDPNYGAGTWCIRCKDGADCATGETCTSEQCFCGFGPSCVHGECNASGICACESGYMGVACNTKIKGYPCKNGMCLPSSSDAQYKTASACGAACSRNTSTTPIVLGIIGGIILLLILYLYWTK